LGSAGVAVDERFILFKDKYIWNNEKNEANKKKHEISFEQATNVFEDPFAYEIHDTENSIDEDRYRIIGSITGLFNGRFITVSFTYRDELIRIFSARDASPGEVREYNNGIRNFFGE
jgi:uncharacterized DUF497 family protein